MWPDQRSKQTHLTLLPSKFKKLFTEWEKVGSNGKISKNSFQEGSQEQRKIRNFHPQLKDKMRELKKHRFYSLMSTLDQKLSASLFTVVMRNAWSKLPNNLLVSMTWMPKVNQSWWNYSNNKWKACSRKYQKTKRARTISDIEWIIFKNQI